MPPLPTVRGGGIMFTVSEYVRACVRRELRPVEHDNSGTG